MDIPKFHKIEKLIERSVEKVALPPELGEAPEWKEYQPKPPRRRNHTAHQQNGGKRKFFYRKKKTGQKPQNNKTE